MKRFQKFLSFLLATGSLAAIGQAQVVNPSDSANLTTLASLSGINYVKAAETPSQVRYVLFNKPNPADDRYSQVYLGRFGKNGNLRFVKKIYDYYSLDSMSIGVDGDDAVYVAINISDRECYFQKYDDDGNLLAEKQFPAPTAWFYKSNWGTNIQEIVVRPNGDIMTCGAALNNSARSKGAVMRWKPDLSDYDALSKFNAIALALDMDFAADGTIFVCGRGVDSSALRGTIGVVSPDLAKNASFTVGPSDDFSIKNGSNSSDRLISIAVDPISGLAMATGFANGIWNDTSITGNLHGYYSTIKATLSGSSYTCVTSMNVLKNTRCDNLKVLACPSGGFFTNCFNTEQSSNDLMKWDVNGSGDGVILTDSDTITQQPVLSQLLMGPDGPLMFAPSTVGPQGETLSGSRYQLYSYSQTGERLSQTMLGDEDSYEAGGQFPILNFTDGEVSVIKRLPSSVQFFSADRVPGPDDFYTVPSGVRLDVPAASGVLANDPTGFPQANLTSSLVDMGSQLESLTLNADGSFEAKAPKGYRGVASFTYQSLQNGNPAGVHTATIQFGHAAPIAVDDSYNVPKKSPVVTLNVLANDFDPEGSILSIISKTTDPNATIALSTDKKSIKFTPKKSFAGTINFSYTVKNAFDMKSTATVTVTVGP